MSTSPTRSDADAPDLRRPTPEQLTAALQTSSDLISAMDLQGRITSWNAGCERLYGWKAEEVIGEPVEMYVPESERDQLALIVRAVRSGEDVPPVETIRLTRDGRRIHVSLRICALRDETGAVFGGVAVGRDITLEVSCRKEVEEARSHLRARLDHTQVAHATLTPSGTYSYANEAYCRLVGRSHADVIGHPVLSFTPPDETERSATLLQELASGARDAVAEPRRLRRPDGSTVGVVAHASTIRSPDGEVAGVAVTLQDVTELRLTQARLSAVRARWRALSRHAVDVGFLAAPDGTLTSVSEALGERFGYTSSQVLGHQAWDFFHPDDVQQARLAWDRVARRQLDRTCFEARIRHADGTWRWVEENVVDLRDEPDVGSLVVSIHDISARRSAEERLGELALYDQLTGLANRALLLDRTGYALERSRQAGAECALLLVGLDDFALVNERLGHAAGDEVLVAVSQLLGAVLSPLDTVARVEADRFAVLVESVQAQSEVRERAGALQSLLSVGVGDRGNSTQLTAGIGAVCGWRSDAAAMLAAAEDALRVAKARGPGELEVFTERSRAAALGRREAVADLRRGVAAGELVLHYQPVIDLATDAPVGVEALVRWQHPERGLLPPDEFLDLAEETGLIRDVGRVVLREACRAAARWPDHGRPLTVAINLSLGQLAERDVVDLVRQALREASLDPARVVLEVTETAVTHDVAAMTETLLALRGLGVEIAMDDFGTGYSSLTYLRRFPVTAVKIDRSFVSGLSADSDDDAIVGSVVSLAAAVGLDCIAEGVEAVEQRDRLLEMGCRYGQGFLWSRPLAERDLLEWLPRQPTAPAAGARPERVPTAPGPGAAAVDQQTAVARRIAELLTQGASLHTIAAALNADGLATAAGARWHPRSVARAIAEGTGQP